MTRKICEIAAEVASEINNGSWPRKNAYAAIPYLNGMAEVETLDEPYYFDSGKSLVSYFLANAGTWRGETARRVKKELNDMLKAARA